MLQRFATRVWINEREFRVNANESVFSGPYAGGIFRKLPNQGGVNAVKARKMAAGEIFCEYAMTDIRLDLDTQAKATEAVSAEHAPAVCEKVPYTAYYANGTWYWQVRCPNCGNLRSQSLNVDGRAEMLCDGVQIKRK